MNRTKHSTLRRNRDRSPTATVVVKEDSMIRITIEIVVRVTGHEHVVRVDAPDAGVADVRDGRNCFRHPASSDVLPDLGIPTAVDSKEIDMARISTPNILVALRARLVLVVNPSSGQISVIKIAVVITTNCPDISTRRAPY